MRRGRKQGHRRNMPCCDRGQKCGIPFGPRTYSSPRRNSAVIARCSRESDDDSTPPYSSASRMVPSADLFPVLCREAKNKSSIRYNYHRNKERGNNHPETLKQPLKNTPASVAYATRARRKDMRATIIHVRTPKSHLRPDPCGRHRHQDHTRIYAYNSNPQMK